MQNLYFSNTNEFNDYLKTLTLLGTGTEGTCYLTPTNEVLKKYHNPEFKDEDAQSLLRFSTITIPTFKFIQNLIYVAHSINGTITEHAFGTSLNILPLMFYPIPSIISSINTLKEDVQKISVQGIAISIYHDSNIVYDGLNFSIIDTNTFYNIQEEPWILYNQNISAITEILIENLIFSSNILSNFLFKISHYRNYRSDYHFLQNPEELITVLKSEIETYCNIELNCFADAKEVLQKKLSL